MSVSKAPIPSPAGSAWDESAVRYRMPPSADDRRYSRRAAVLSRWLSGYLGGSVLLTSAAGPNSPTTLTFALAAGVVERASEPS